MIPPASPFHVPLDHEVFFHKYHLNIRFPFPPQVYKPTLLEKIWKKVRDFFIQMAQILFFWKPHSKFKLTHRQIKLIEQAKKQRKLFDHKSQLFSALKVQPIKSPAVQTETNTTPTEYPKDQVLIRLCTFIEKISKILVVDCIYEEKVLPNIPIWKKLIEENVDQVKKWIDVLVDLKNSAAPLFSSLGNLQGQSLTILAQQLLQILLEPLGDQIKQKQALEEVLILRIKALGTKGKITEEETEKTLALVQPTLSWLLNSNNWLISTPHPMLLHSFLTDASNFVDCFSKLNKQGKLNCYFDEIKTQIHIGFASGLKELLILNTKPIANTISCQVSNLIENLPFKDFFDELLKIFIKQIDGWIIADEHKNEQAFLIPNAKHDAKLHATDATEVDKQNKALELLKSIEDAGGEDHFLVAAFQQAFAQSSSCHPQIKKILESPYTKSPLEDQIFDRIIEEILPSILPPESVELPGGSHIEISGTAKIISAIIYPETFKMIFSQIDKIIQLVKESGEFKDKENFFKFFGELSHIIAAQLAHQRLKESIKEGLKVLFDRLSNKESLDELLGNFILPAAINGIFVDWVRGTIELRVKELAPLFHKFIEHENNFKLCLLTLTDKLYDTMNKLTKEFNLLNSGFTKDKFKELIDPLIIEIISNLLKRLKSDDLNQKISVDEVESALCAYLKETDAPSNTLYSDLTLKILFKVAKFKVPGLGVSLTEAIVTCLKGIITKQISIALHDFTSSFHKSITALIDVGDQHLMDPIKLKELLFPKPIDVHEITALKIKNAATLAQNMERISALGHDALYRYLEGWKGGSLYKLGTPSKATIQGMISSIVNKLFGNPMLNKNLYLKIFEEIANCFKKISQPKSNKVPLAKSMSVLSSGEFKSD